MTNRVLQLHPEYRTLADENALLREELAHLLTEEHDLVHITKPHLLALYQQKIGACELRHLEARIAAAWARRRLELVQAAVNQGRRPNLQEIEGLLELEFLAWRQQVMEAAERLTAAEYRLSHLLSAGEDRELRALYYQLVKQLHPDLNPVPDEHHHRLWRRVQAAYEHSDIQELRALALLAEQANPSVPEQRALELLRQHREILEAQITALLQRIEAIERQPPFHLRAQLADETWLMERQKELATQTAQCEAQRLALEAHLQGLLRSLSDGQIFGAN